MASWKPSPVMASRKPLHFQETYNIRIREAPSVNGFQNAQSVKGFQEAQPGNGFQEAQPGNGFQEAPPVNPFSFPIS